MKPPIKFPTFLILAAAISTAGLGLLAPSSLAQPSGKAGAKKVGEAVKPSSAAKTEDRAAAKAKGEAPKAESPKMEVPPVVNDPAAKEKAAESAKAAHEVVDYSALLFVFVMATFIGLGVVARVSRLLHTPLMSLTNAISAIAVVGSIIVTGSDYPLVIRIMGAIALFASMTNVVSGFLITDRMLKMFKQTRTEGK